MVEEQGEQQSKASFAQPRVAQPSLVPQSSRASLRVVRSCSRCLGASAERTPSPRIEPTGDCGLLVKGADGGAQRFVDSVPGPDGDRVYSALHGYKGTLVAHLDGSFDYFSIDGTRYHYGQPAQDGVVGVFLQTVLLFIEDVDGNRIDYRYARSDIDGELRVIELADSAGRTLHFEYMAFEEQCISTIIKPNNQRECLGSRRHSVLKRVSGPDGLGVNYLYDTEAGKGMLLAALRGAAGSGQCANASDAPGHCESYSYTDLGRSAYVLPNAEFPTVVHHGLALTGIGQTSNGASGFAYDRLSLAQLIFDGTQWVEIRIPSYGVKQLTAFDSSPWAFAYNPPERGLVTATTTVTDGRGQPTVHTLNRHGAAEKVQDAAGTTLTVWDLTHFQPASVTDALGRVSTFSYDDYGNKTSETIAGSVTRSWTFKPTSDFAVPIKNRAARFVDARGIEETYTYDERGHLTARRRAGVMESFAYDGRGDRVRQTDFNGGVWGFGFDAFGYPASQSNPLGQIARSLYDARGRLQSETDANGHSTTHSYDASDRRTASTLAGVGGGTRRTAYASAGRIQTATDEVGEVTVSVFDALGRLTNVLEEIDGQTEIRSLQYDGNGNKVRETDFRGNLTRFEYDNANRLTKTTAPLGKVTTLTVDALGHVLSETVTGPNSATRRTEYSYDHPLYFRTETRQLGGAGGDRITKVAPDNAGNPLRTTDPLGRVTTRAFDAFDRVTRIVEPARTTELAYDPNGNKLTEIVSGQDAIVRTRRFVYDAANRNLSVTDGSGNISHSTYFPNGEVESRIDARGGTVRFTLDAANRVIETRGPRADQVTTAAYDGVGNRLRERLANGRELTHQYDALHRLQASRDQLGEILRRTYDADGNLTRETDALGATTTYTVNALNQRLAAVLPEGRRQSWTYSVHDEVLTETSPTNAVTTHSYDALGQRIGTVLPTGAGASQPRSWTYDLAGNVKTQTDSNGVVASFDYDQQNRRIRAQIDANDGGQAETWTYDARDNALTHTDRAGIGERFTYDREDRRLTRSRAGSLRETNAYDPNGNLASQRDANGHTTVFQYDAANQRTERAAPGAGGLPETETWTYTASNQIATHTDAEGSRSTFSYDARDRVLTEKNGENETRSYSYDGNGNRTGITLPSGAAWAQAFDQANRLVTVTSPEGTATRYGYHPDDQLASITDGNGHAVSLSSDALARITQRVYPGGVAFATEYDGEGNAIQDTRPDSAIARQFDALNRVKTASYTAIGGNNASIHTNYDPNGNPTSQALDQDSRTLSTQRSYDDQNRLEREEAQNGALLILGSVTPAVIPAKAGTQLKTTARSATTSAQLKNTARSATTPSSSAIAQPYTHTQRYTLDSNGNRTTVTDAANTTTQQSFDAQNRLTVSTTANEGSTSNHWNKDGTLASIDHSVAPAVIPANAGTQLKTAARSATPSAQPTTNQTRYTYDRAKRITEITHTQNGATTLSFTYSYDQNGNRSSETRTQSAINGQAGSIQTTAYAYDRDDRLIQTTVTHQPPDPATPDERTDWTLDAVGNRLTETVTRMADNTVSSNKTYAYSDRDQLTLMTDSVHQLSVAYTYDQNGNRTSRTVTRQGQPAETIRYSFDARDRLISAQPNAPNPGNAATIAYTYDADGRRIERIETPVGATPVVATLYLYNGSTLQHEATPDATANTANATGLRLTDTYRTSAKLDRHIAFDLAGTPTVRLYQLDALDSPVALTDASGATVTRTTFDAWGNIEQQTANGITQTPWQLPNYNPDQTGQAALLSQDGQILGFIGFQKDSATGLYYAGARWYDPLVGGFNGMDAFAGDPAVPVTFNKYLYGSANPARYTDRTGRCSAENSFRCGLAQAVAFSGNDQNRKVAEGVLAAYDAQVASRRNAVATGVARSVADSGQTLATLAADTIYVIPEALLPDRADLGSRVRFIQALVGIGKFARSPIESTRTNFVSKLERAQQFRDAGNDFETKVAETEAFFDIATTALGAQQAVRGGVRLGLRTTGRNALAESAGGSAPEIGPRDFDLDLGGGINRGGLGSLGRAADATPTPPNALGDGAGVPKGVRAKELPTGGTGTLSNVQPASISPAEQARALRGSLNIPQGMRNVAFADIIIDGERSSIGAVSGKLSPAGTAPTPTSRLFSVQDSGAIPRGFDTEVKILEEIARTLHRDSTGKINLFTERPPCSSCSKVIAQFKEMFPNVEVSVSNGQ